jgi:hypothetical protein
MLPHLLTFGIQNFCVDGQLCNPLNFSACLSLQLLCFNIFPIFYCLTYKFSVVATACFSALLLCGVLMWLI